MNGPWKIREAFALPGPFYRLLSRRRVQYTLASGVRSATPLKTKAGVAQMVEQLTCNQQVGGSIPFAGSIPFLPEKPANVGRNARLRVFFYSTLISPRPGMHPRNVNPVGLRRTRSDLVRQKSDKPNSPRQPLSQADFHDDREVNPRVYLCGRILPAWPQRP